MPSPLSSCSGSDVPFQVKEFYGLKGLSAESIYVREDFKQDNQATKADTGSKSVYYLPPVTRELLESDNQGE
jgi:hypothetical protein